MSSSDEVVTGQVPVEEPDETEETDEAVGTTGGVPDAPTGIGEYTSVESQARLVGGIERLKAMLSEPRVSDDA